MSNAKKIFLFLVLVCVPFCLGAAGLKEAYNCGQAAEFLAINADAYSDPSPSVDYILEGTSPYAPLTHLKGCQMILRAFGPLPDVQSGVRYYAKYRDCDFVDVPEDGKTAVENLVNAGLYVPEDNTVFGPYQLMTEDELAVLVDRIHAYLQSSPKDDYYSWAMADILNDPQFFNRAYDLSTYNINSEDREKLTIWLFDMLNDCLENPDSPEKANIAAYMSTYMDMEGRENSMQFIQPMLDAIWNAPDFQALTDVCADISCETGIELLLTKPYWADWADLDFYVESNGHSVQAIGYEFFSTGKTPEDFLPGHYSYDATMEQWLRLYTYLGYDKEEAENAIHIYLNGIRHEGQILYDSSTLTKKAIREIPEEDDPDLAYFPLRQYLEKSQFDYCEEIVLDNYAEACITLSLMSKPENLPGVKVYLMRRLLISLCEVIPPVLWDLVNGFWDPYYAADPSQYFNINELIQEAVTLFQADTFVYYSKTPEYAAMHEYLEKLCQSIKSYYRTMLENVTWLNPETKTVVLEKLDAMGVELLIPQDLSGLFRVDFTSAEDGGTLYGNITKFIKERRQWLSKHFSGDDVGFAWNIEGNWVKSYYYSLFANSFFITMYGFLGSHAEPDSPDEELLGYIGLSIAHEISHAFDNNGSLFNKYGQREDLWTKEDRQEFNRRCMNLAQFMSNYEVYPGIVYKDGTHVVGETVADLTAMKCIMSIASQIPDFNYKAFFSCYAEEFVISFTRKAWETQLVYDPHPQGRSRVNRILSLTDEFYTTFDIQPGDAMYVAPQDRPVVW